LLALAVVVGPDAVTAAENGAIIIGNSQAPDADPCTLEVEASVISQLRILGVERWAEACEIAKSATESTGLRGNVRIRIEDNQ
ncbi:MAG: hypothetical protein AAFY56_21045, partial [Pseudomonadota bacterium]